MNRNTNEGRSASCIFILVNLRAELVSPLENRGVVNDPVLMLFF